MTEAEFTALDGDLPTVRMLPATHSRVETGAVQFGDDWPGLFVRGDDCIALTLALPQLREMAHALPLSERLPLLRALAVMEQARGTRYGPPRRSAED